jgi:hypothetical protein
MPTTWPSGPDAPGELHGGVAEAAAYIEHAVAGMHRQGGEHRLAVLGEPIDEDVLEADEFRRQHFVPELDEGGVFGRGLGLHGHEASPTGPSGARTAMET